MGEASTPKSLKHQTIENRITGIARAIRELEGLAADITNGQKYQKGELDEKQQPDIVSLREFLDTAPSRLEELRERIIKATSAIQESVF